jgi:hypothetical protein
MTIAFQKQFKTDNNGNNKLQQAILKNDTLTNIREILDNFIVIMAVEGDVSYNGINRFCNNKNKKGDTALTMAIKNNDSDLVELLLTYHNSNADFTAVDGKKKDCLRLLEENCMVVEGNGESGSGGSGSGGSGKEDKCSNLKKILLESEWTNNLEKGITAGKYFDDKRKKEDEDFRRNILVGVIVGVSLVLLILLIYLVMRDCNRKGYFSKLGKRLGMCKRVNKK